MNHDYLVPAHQHQFGFSTDYAPVLTVQPGAVVRIETSTEPVELLFAAGKRWVKAANWKRINAITGPILIEGVEPGDAVSVEVLAIETLDWGWCAAVPGPGMLQPFIMQAMLRRIPIEGGQVHLTERISAPLRPMIGCLGLAPATGESSALAPPYPWGGNYDLLQIRAGCTVYLPAQVSGGLFSLGDLHAAMGDGEAASFSIECAGATTVRLGVVKGMALETPRIDGGDRIYTVGLAGRGDWVAARTQAVRLMFQYLIAEGGLSTEEAYLITAASVDLTFGGPAGAVAVAGCPRAVFGGI